MTDDARAEELLAAIVDEEASQDGQNEPQGDEDGQDAGEGQEGTPNDSESRTEEPDTFPRTYVEKLRRESASYRERAQKTETAMSRLADLTITNATRGILIDPSDLPYDPETMSDDDGYPDLEKITDAAKELVKQKPHLADRRPKGDIGQGAKREEADVDLAGILRERAG